MELILQNVLLNCFYIFAGKSIIDYDLKQLLRILVKALESFSDITLIDAIIMCLTRLQPLLRPVIILYELFVISFRCAKCKLVFSL